MCDGMATQALMNLLYFAAKDGMPIALHFILTERLERDHGQITIDIVNENCYDENDGHECTLLTIAARQGHSKVVKILLNKFNPDLEKEGTVKFKDFVVEGATALWSAVGEGHLDVVKLLVKAGADVNHATKTNSTPLRAASYNGRLDIATYLVEHGADLTIANNFNSTCLMIATYRGHTDLVQYLLEKNADPNQKAQGGLTALHFAAEYGHAEIINMLLSHGAILTKNDAGITPLLTAAALIKTEVVDTLISSGRVSKEEEIDSLELLGASYANDKDNYCPATAYLYLSRAMELRFCDPDNVIRKKLAEPVAAYQNWIECQSLSELESIRHNYNSIHMEALTIRERILGSNHPEIPHAVIFRGAVLADEARFERCVALWTHALNLRQRYSKSIAKDLLRLAQVFSQMVSLNVFVPADSLSEILEANVAQLRRNMGKQSCLHGEDAEYLKEDNQNNLCNALYIIFIFTRLQKQYNESERERIHSLITQLNQLRVLGKMSRSLLHMAVSSDTPVEEFHISEVCRFPSVEVTTTLLQCGASPNAIDINGDTPLHLIVTYDKPISDFYVLHSIIVTLIHYGAHADVVNCYGETPAVRAVTHVAEIILRAETQLNLQCLCANVITKNAIKYERLVPKLLERFVGLHRRPIAELFDC